MNSGRSIAENDHSKIAGQGLIMKIYCRGAIPSSGLGLEAVLTRRERFLRVSVVSLVPDDRCNLFLVPVSWALSPVLAGIETDYELLIAPAASGKSVIIGLGPVVPVLEAIGS